MAHLPPDFLGALPPLSQSQTLFLPAPGRLGILVRQRGGRSVAARRRFKSGEAAFAWCLARRVNLVFWHPPVAANN